VTPRIFPSIESWQQNGYAVSEESAIWDSQSVKTWRCNAHYYYLREARCLINHIFDM